MNVTVLRFVASTVPGRNHTTYASAEGRRTPHPPSLSSRGSGADPEDLEKAAPCGAEPVTARGLGSVSHTPHWVSRGIGREKGRIRDPLAQPPHEILSKFTEAVHPARDIVFQF